MPPALVIDQIGSNFVLRRMRGDRDVEHVMPFRFGYETTQASTQAIDP